MNVKKLLVFMLVVDAVRTLKIQAGIVDDAPPSRLNTPARARYLEPETQALMTYEIY